MDLAGGGLTLLVSVNGGPFGTPGAVAEGDCLSVSVKSPRRGYLTLFNVGTSGTATRLLPMRPVEPPPGVVADSWLSAPGELADSEKFPCGSWVENGPPTTATGLRERLVAVVADRPWLLSPQCVPGLPVAPRGSIAAVSDEVSSLAALPAGSWTLAETAFEVVPASRSAECGRNPGSLAASRHGFVGESPRELP